IAFEARLVLSRDPTPKKMSALRGLFEKTVNIPRTPVLQATSLRISENPQPNAAFVLRQLGGLKAVAGVLRSEEHTSELQSLRHLVCRLLLEKKKKKKNNLTMNIMNNDMTQSFV